MAIAPHNRLILHGRYINEELPARLAGINPHLAWFPAQWPETYCYTLSACLQAGLPVVATDLGAFPERLAGRPWSWIRPWQTRPVAWNDFFVAIRTQHFANGSPPFPPTGQAPTPELDYIQEYLQPFSGKSREPTVIPNHLATLISACIAEEPILEELLAPDIIPAPVIQEVAARLIAFYLPQFHPIPENDQWWGKGFTEWRNVTKATPLFDGHYQPHLPADLGFYDLRLIETHIEQAELARRYGIYGFCYYYYWFNGRRLLERPLDDMLHLGQPNFPFCLCWANEHWTRRWDGSDQDILIEQTYSETNARHIIRDLIPFLRDPRYITVAGRPLLLIYRTESIPNVPVMVGIWREEAVMAGLSGIYLVRVESFYRCDPHALGFDAACEFRPGLNWPPPLNSNQFPDLAADFTGYLFDYKTMAALAMQQETPNYRLFRSVMLGWDNTARVGKRAHIVVGSSPAIYQCWLAHSINCTLIYRQNDERLIFINAWNEWAEGCHLEPDLRYGHQFLEATQQALTHPQPWDANQFLEATQQALTHQQSPDTGYNAWLQRHRWDDLACRHLLELTQHQATLPLIHWLIVLPASQSALLGSTLISLAQQTLAAWRLTVIADFACPSPEFAQMDELSWIRLNSWEELSNALADQARQSPAEWFWCGYPGIQLEPVFINLAVELISRHPEWRFVYTDEDVVGQRLDQEYWSRPQFKPDANLDLLRSSGYIGHASLVHRELWESLPSVELRPGLLLNYAAALRCFEQFGEAAVGHIDEMVFHQPETASVDWSAFARDALPLLSGHLQRQKLAATVNAGSLPGTFRVNYRLTQTPLISIIIPTRNRLDLIQSCLDSLLARTRYPHFEVLIVDNRSDEPAVLDYLQQQTRQDARVRVIPYPDEYNYSAINNHAAQLAQGEFLLLLNNDTVILRDDWLATLVAIGLRPDVGAVGGRLIYPDHSVQHAGIIVGLGGVADHIGVGLPLGKSGYMGRAQLNQNFSAVTAACLLVRRQVFFEVGGLDERDFAVLFNDVDFCLKLGTRGYRIVWSPSVTLIHHGSSTLQSEVDIQRLAHTRREQFALIEKWRARLIHDPAYNRHLSLRHRNWRLDEAMDALWHPEFDPLSRVVALPCDDAGVGHYRVSGPIGELTRHARIRSLLLPDGQSPRRFMPEPIELSRIKAQVLLLQNAFTDWQLPALKVYAQLNPDLFKVFGLDDLVFALPANHPARQYLGKDIKTRLRQGLAGCDRAVVTSEPIAEALRSLIADIRVMPNYLERSRWAGLHVPRQEHRKPRVGWAGGIHHAGDLALLQPVIEATAAEVDWVFMGLCLDAARPWVAEVHPGTPFDAYPAALAALDLDLAVAPLEHHRFNRAKSNLRLLEYGVLGWPVVCTDILPYQNAPVTRTPNNPDAWIKAIREHIHNPEASIAMGAELQTWVLTHWMLDQHLDDWLNALLPEATLMRNPT
ncbi:MAG: glycoside hydrolase family 99-like domain-containing protein [Candidatus Competibacteraceae bacterium]|nr:glycoside hydrolase family 99-like domain-containing protein [Candidatus Competibacteraceae bacterium]